MPDLNEQLSSILQNPQAQESIRRLMGILRQPEQNAQAPPQPQPGGAKNFDLTSLLSGFQPPPPQNPEPSDGFDINTLLKIQQIFSKMNCDDKNICLLRALRPYLKDPKKADDAINMLKLLSVLPALRDCGIFGRG